MKNLLVTGSCILVLLATMNTGCRKKAFDDYYGSPDSLAQPIYQQLQARGKFKNLLACIDKASYKSILSAAGYWTMFAPNDSAFQVFFQQRGISSISQLDSGTCQKIVTYSLAYNAFAKARLGDYQSATGWVPSQAFKRRTAYYKGFYNDTTPAGAPVLALASNRNNTNGTNYFVQGDNNNKYIAYFVDNFMSARALSASDYNYFFPNTAYTGFNVMDAKVVTPDIFAENGYIHEIDKVLLPPPSIDEYLASNPQYSEFKKLYDKYLVTFTQNPAATTNYNLITGLNTPIYIKTFNAGLAYSPNNENYLKLTDNDGQTDGWSLFVPRNDVLDNYINSVILENYKSVDQLPLQIIIDLLNAHMWQSSVWPSKFATTNNFQAEPARFDPNADIIDKQILSNGFFYGTSKVQQANVFSTVFGKAYLDPKYLLMTQALNQNFRYTITLPTEKFTVIMMSDSVLRAYGYDYNTNYSQWQFTPPGTTATTISSAVNDQLQRILATHIIPTPNDDLADLSGSGIIATLNGEYIKYNAGQLISTGSQDSGYVVTVTGTKTASNGRVYYANNLLDYGVKNLGTYIAGLGTATTSDFNYFYQYLKNSLLYTAATGTILGVSPGVFYTVFVPNNAAIVAAVNAGLLPGTGGVPNFAPTVASDQALVSNFILYHILNKNTVVPDGKKTGSFETLFKNTNGDATTLSISSALNSMQVTDTYGRTANVIIGSSNNLADRCVIHLIDNYLQYNPN